MTDTSPPAALRPSRRRLLQIAGVGLAAGAGTFALTSARAGTGTRLHILHINDMHSRIEAVTRLDSTCDDAAADGACFGGAARLATAIRTRRAALAAQGVPVMTLDAGDQSQGSLFYTTHGGLAEVEMMNLIGFDAMTLGNHEFNRGPEALARMLAAADFPVVAGNVRVAPGHPLAPLVRDRLVLQTAAGAVGVLGVTTPDTVFLSSPGPDVAFEDPVTHLTRAAAALRADGVVRILVLSHLGFRRDRDIAAQVPGLSLIVGGHSHTLMSNSVAGAPAYATLVEGPAGRAVPIVQAYAFSRYLGDLGVEFDGDGAVIAATGDTVALSMAAFAEAPDVAARIAALAVPIEALRRTQVATLATGIDASRAACRTGECEMGNTVAEAMLARMAPAGAVAALTNAGGLRESLPAGAVTLGDVLTVLPFQNTLVTLDLPGAILLAALEHGVNAVEEGAGRFPQVAGLRFRLDLGVGPDAGRVSGVEVRGPDGWAPLDRGAVYTVVTNSFLARGGDGYAMLAAEGRTPYDTAIDLADALAGYLADLTADGQPFAPVLDGRIAQ